MKALFNIISYFPFLIVAFYVLMDIYREHPEVKHTTQFKTRRVINWLPLGFTYAFLYMARYNINACKIALGDLMTKEAFGTIFGLGAIVYAVSFLINGPLTDKFGGKKAILVGAIGAAFANILMGIFLYGKLALGWGMNLTLAFTLLYALNMYFQSFGAVAIVKVNASWFHVRERGVFGGIFGILISLGLYFAFDWGTAIVNATKASVADVNLSWLQSGLRSLLGISGALDQTWWVFIIPAFILIVFAILDILIIRDAPSGAGYKNFDTADASSGEEDKPFKLGEILRKILTNKILLTIAFIEFCTGLLRQGVMQWYPIFLKDFLNLGSGAFMRANWGLIMMLAGVFGGMIAGVVSDKVFQSRRGPVAAWFYALMFVAVGVMIFVVKADQTWLAISAVFMSFCVIGTHGMLSGTSTMDFGGRRAAGTAVGLIDGFVYLGTGFQGLCLGAITTKDWGLWPVFMIPFTVIGFLLALRIWKAIPKAAKKVEAVMNPAIEPGAALAGGEVPED